jgi:hypothetical protein
MKQYKSKKGNLIDYMITIWVEVKRKSKAGVEYKKYKSKIDGEFPKGMNRKNLRTAVFKKKK